VSSYRASLAGLLLLGCTATRLRARPSAIWLRAELATQRKRMLLNCMEASGGARLKCDAGTVGERDEGEHHGPPTTGLQPPCQHQTVRLRHLQNDRLDEVCAQVPQSRNPLVAVDEDVPVAVGHHDHRLPLPLSCKGRREPAQTARTDDPEVPVPKVDLVPLELHALSSTGPVQPVLTPSCAR